jgi:hypothetical protein
MLHCIIGAIMLCGSNANITIDGPLAYARPATTSYAWSYAAYYAAPTYTQPRFLGIFRRG